MNCPYCGLELLETSLGNYFCSNHGIVYENPDNKESSNDEASYIG